MLRQLVEKNYNAFEINEFQEKWGPWIGHWLWETRRFQVLKHRKQSFSPFSARFFAYSLKNTISRTKDIFICPKTDWPVVDQKKLSELGYFSFRPGFLEPFFDNFSDLDAIFVKIILSRFGYGNLGQNPGTAKDDDFVDSRCTFHGCCAKYNGQNVPNHSQLETGTKEITKFAKFVEFSEKPETIEVTRRFHYEIQAEIWHRFALKTAFFESHQFPSLWSTAFIAFRTPILLRHRLRAVTIPWNLELSGILQLLENSRLRTLSYVSENLVAQKSFFACL